MTEQDNKTESNTFVTQDDLQSECRGCLVKLNVQTGIFHLFTMWTPGLYGEESIIAEDLAKLANIQISPKDRHSKVICKICYTKLQEACHFASYVQKNDLMLQQRFAQKLEYGEEWPKPIQVDKNINGSVFENSMNVEIKQEVLSDEELDTNSNVNLSREQEFANLDIKIEPEEIMEPQPIKITVNGTISDFDQLNTDNLTVNFKSNGSDINEVGDEFKVKVKEEPLSENEELEPMTDLPLECMLCAKIFCRVSGLKAHVIAHHSYKTVKRKSGNTDVKAPQRKHSKYVCVICRRSFSTSTDLMVHETCHNKDVCYGCSEKFDTFQQLFTHRELCTAILNKTVQKPKTLEDVKRPQYSPNLDQSMDEVKKVKEEPSLTCKEVNSDNNMNIKIDIHSLKSEPTSEDSNNTVVSVLEGVSGEGK